MLGTGCWKKRGENEETNDVGVTGDLHDIADMFQTIPGFSDCNKNDAQLWLENYNDPSYQILNGDEVLSFTQKGEYTLVADEDCGQENGEETERSGPSYEEAFAALENVMSWHEQQEESCPNQLLLLKKMFYSAA